MRRLVQDEYLDQRAWVKSQRPADWASMTYDEKVAWDDEMMDRYEEEK